MYLVNGKTQDNTICPLEGAKVCHGGVQLGKNYIELFLWNQLTDFKVIWQGSFH